MVLFSLRAVAAIVAATHLGRNLWWSHPETDLAADVQIFRLELARGQRLLDRTNEALEGCLRDSDLKHYVLKLSGWTELILAICLGFVLFRGRWQPSGTLATADCGNESAPCKPEDSPAQIKGEIGESSLEAWPVGPVTAGELRRRRQEERHGGRA